MIVINERNVNGALLSALIHVNHGRVISPRGAETLEVQHPVATVYERPCERVLFCEKRDANPFFHLFESLWIISGRQDTAWLKRFNSNIGSYSDDGIVFNAAYGFRLREHFGVDQLELAIEQLMKDPDSRRVVLTIWDVEDLTKESKDIPCNDLIMFKIRDGKLNMTVLNRSNDIIWGCYGANVVHFSMIQEYVAGKLDIPVGVYRQVSDSLHVYTNNPLWPVLRDQYIVRDLYTEAEVEPLPIMDNAAKWDEDLQLFMGLTSPHRSEGEALDLKASKAFYNRFFSEVVWPMYRSWLMHKLYRDGLPDAQSIAASDWRLACVEWLERRYAKEQSA